MILTAEMGKTLFGRGRQQILIGLLPSRIDRYAQHGETTWSEQTEQFTDLLPIIVDMFQHVMRDDQVVTGIGQRDLSDVDPVRDTRRVQNALAVKRVVTTFLYPKLGEDGPGDAPATGFDLATTADFASSQLMGPSPDVRVREPCLCPVSRDRNYLDPLGSHPASAPAW